MRVRFFTILSVVLALSVGVAAAAAAPKQPYPASQQLCASFGGTFSTKANSSFYRPQYKKQGVVWTCNGYSGSTASDALRQACFGDGGLAMSTDAPGFATCWKNP
jgi:hypothetical protein